MAAYGKTPERRKQPEPLGNGNKRKK